MRSEEHTGLEHKKIYRRNKAIAVFKLLITGAGYILLCWVVSNLLATALVHVLLY